MDNAHSRLLLTGSGEGAGRVSASAGRERGMAIQTVCTLLMPALRRAVAGIDVAHRGERLALS